MTYVQWVTFVVSSVNWKKVVAGRTFVGEIDVHVNDVTRDSWSAELYLCADGCWREWYKAVASGRVFYYVEVRMLENGLVITIDGQEFRVSDSEVNLLPWVVKIMRANLYTYEQMRDVGGY
jgi:hypothetical protein